MIFLTSSTSLAQDSCMVRPSCADMGFYKTQAECEGKDFIRCIFDASAYYCPESGENCDFGDYTLIECPANGVCDYYDCGGATQYKLDSCKSGYKLNSDNTGCEICTWGAYTSKDCPIGRRCSPKECGNTIQYRVLGCDDGYYEIYGDCEECTNGCDVYGDIHEFDSTNKPNGAYILCGECDTGIVYYHITGCDTDEKLNDAGDNCIPCDETGEYKYFVCPYEDQGAICDSIQCGNNTLYRFLGCKEGSIEIEGADICELAE